MRIATAGETVESGLWLDIRTLRVHLQERGDGPLPGAEATRYARIPILLWIILGPVLGFVYVVILPLVGAALVVRELFAKGRALAAKDSRRRAGVPSPR